MTQKRATFELRSSSSFSERNIDTHAREVLHCKGCAPSGYRVQRGDKPIAQHGQAPLSRPVAQAMTERVIPRTQPQLIAAPSHSTSAPRDSSALPGSPPLEHAVVHVRQHRLISLKPSPDITGTSLSSTDMLGRRPFRLSAGPPIALIMSCLV
ncbi:hypothetical protein C8Q79DRAFT_645699 [Trametes meyenii]|nr:hypothetical protein C8Q79DRAFT_645699 [Trametes meyenii]